jgi:hypothetical protein
MTTVSFNSAAFMSTDAIIALNRQMPGADPGMVIMCEWGDYETMRALDSKAQELPYEEDLLDRVIEWHSKGCYWRHDDNFFCRNAQGQTLECWQYCPSMPGAPTLVVCEPKWGTSDQGIRVSLKQIHRERTENGPETIITQEQLQSIITYALTWEHAQGGTTWCETGPGEGVIWTKFDWSRNLTPQELEDRVINPGIEWACCLYWGEESGDLDIWRFDIENQSFELRVYSGWDTKTPQCDMVGLANMRY